MKHWNHLDFVWSYVIEPTLKGGAEKHGDFGGPTWIFFRFLGSKLENVDVFFVQLRFVWRCSTRIGIELSKLGTEKEHVKLEG